MGYRPEALAARIRDIPESGSFGSHFSFFEIDFLVALVSEHPGN